MTVSVETPAVPTVIKPGHRFRFTHRGEDVEYVVVLAESDLTLNPAARIVELRRADADLDGTKRAQVTERWLRMGPPGYSGYWTFLGEGS
jgi:hypothetical protein